MNVEIVPETKTGEDENPQAPSQRTEQEKAVFNLKRNIEKAKELGVDISEIIGKPMTEVDDSLPDETPLTIGTFRDMQKKDAKKTALQLADGIEDEAERTNVKAILNRLSPSGDAHADLALARGSANSAKNKQIVEELQRKGDPARYVNNPGAGGKAPEELFEPTAEEASMMRAPFNLTQEEVLKARPK